MEKLKAKHDHKLTDILKVAIFGLMLILPGLILLPSMLYYGVNEYATAPTEQVEKIEYERVNFNQLYKGNGTTQTATGGTATFLNDEINIFVDTTVSTDLYFAVPVEVNFNNTHLYYLKANSNSNFQLYTYIDSAYKPITNDYVIPLNKGSEISTFLITTNTTGTYTIKFNIFDITKMFGNGNEPSTTDFAQWYNNYYEYTEGRYEILEKPTGTYETYTDITSQIQYNWNSLWQQPLFSWTNYTILKQGLDNFTYVFGITQTSYINNLIVYELIIVAIYIVIDIVLTLFKWLTHLIGEK